MHGVNFENPWLLGVDRARRRLPAWAAALGSVVFAACVLLTFKAIGASLVGALSGAVTGLPDGWGAAVAQGVLQILVFAPFLAVTVVGVRLEGRWIGGEAGRGVHRALAGLLLGMVGFGASVAIAWAARAIEPGAAAALSPVAISFAFGVAVVGFQAFAEEAFFRAWLQPLLSIQWGPWIGLVGTSILFAGLHIIAGANSVLAVVNLFLGGMMFGLLALRSGGLAAPVAAHFAWNWTETGGLGLDPSPTGSLISLRLHGAPLWSGGADTMNGSLATTIVLIVIVAGLMVAGSIRSGPRAGGRSDRAP